jgi:hypothetical protein
MWLVDPGIGGSVQRFPPPPGQEASHSNTRGIDDYQHEGDRERGSLVPWIALVGVQAEEEGMNSQCSYTGSYHDSGNERIEIPYQPGQQQEQKPYFPPPPGQEASHSNTRGIDDYQQIPSVAILARIMTRGMRGLRLMT